MESDQKASHPSSDDLSCGPPPFRICLAGGWLDQPFMSQVVSGPVICVNIYVRQQHEMNIVSYTHERWMDSVYTCT